LLLRARVWEHLARAGEPEHAADALHDYEKAVKLNPSFEARLGRADTLHRLGRTWDALREYERLHREQADHPGVLLGLARCRYRLYEVDQARQILDKLLKGHPDHGDALLERGRLSFHADRLAEAETFLRRAVAVAPQSESEPLRCLYQCLLARDKDGAARRCLARLQHNEEALLRVNRLILQANRDPHDLALRFRIGRRLMAQGRESEAVAGLYHVLDQDPRNKHAHAALAAYFERAGKPRRAARHRRAALQGAS
jgi:tetratricopeptide (TPR) repeat protein